jgi:hypothetical protein
MLIFMPDSKKRLIIVAQGPRRRFQLQIFPIILEEFDDAGYSFVALLS